VARTNPPIACRDGNTHKNIITYIKSLIRYLTKANPKTFKGDLDGSKICVMVEDDDRIGASMEPNSGQMRINTGLFLKKNGFDSDAAIATVIAHELAHFTMDHANARPTALDLPSDYDDAAYKKKLAEYKAIETKASVMIGEAFDRVAKQYGEGLVISMTPVFDEIRALKGDNPNQQRDIGWTVNLFDEFKADVDSLRKSGDEKEYSRRMSGYLLRHVEQAQTYRPKISLVLRDAAEPWATMATALELKNRLVAAAKKYELSKEDLVPDLKRLRAPHFQWDEEQADEVGLEFFIRGGFEPRVYPEVFNQLAQNLEGAGDCAKEVNPNLMPPRIHPDREPRGNHPDACWRYWNLRFNEPKIHDAEYTRIMPSVTLMDLPQLSGQREAIEQEVSR
jgi:hypothetical protein